MTGELKRPAAPLAVTAYTNTATAPKPRTLTIRNAKPAPLLDDPVTPATTVVAPAPPALPAAEESVTSVPPAAESEPAATAGPLVSAVPSGTASQMSDSTPVLAIETMGPDEINAGRPAAFVITVRNLGSQTAEDVQVRVTLPAHAEWKESQPRPAQQEDRDLVFAVGHMPAEAQREIRLEVLPRQSLPLNLTTSASFSINSERVAEEPKSPLTLVCEAPPQAARGAPVVFRLRVRNTGDSVCEGVVVTARLPAAAIPPGQTPQPFAAGALGPGETREAIFSAVASGADALEATFTATSANGGTASADARIQIGRSLIKVAVDGPQVNYVQREGRYVIEVSNFGDSAAREVKIIDMLPPGLQLTVVDRAVDFSAPTKTVTWTLPLLPPGATEVLQFKARSTAEGPQPQRVVATAAGGLQADAQYETLVISRPLLNIAVNSANGPLEINDQATFNVVLKNTGTQEATAVKVKLVMPDGLQMAEQDGVVADERGARFPDMALASGAEKTLTVRAFGRKAGDLVLRVVLESDGLSQPLIAEGSAFFYDGGQTESPAIRQAAHPPAAERLRR